MHVSLGEEEGTSQPLGNLAWNLSRSSGGGRRKLRAPGEKNQLSTAGSWKLR